ncbi:MAG: inner membrane protein YiaA [Aeromonas sp.]
MPDVHISGPYKAATLACLVASVSAYLIGLWNAQMELNEKGYYLICLLFGLFSAISLQKVIRDKAEGLFVSEKYKAICLVATAAAIALFLVGLWNATLLLSEKGFYIMAFLLALFTSATMQKNERDQASIRREVSHESLPPSLGDS